MNILQCESLADVLQATRQNDIDFAILPQDLNRPSWLTVMREIKKIAPAVRVVILTLARLRKMSLVPSVDLCLNYPSEIEKINELPDYPFALSPPNPAHHSDRIFKLLHRQQALMETLAGNYSYISILQELTKCWADVFHASLAACLTLDPNDCLIVTSQTTYQLPTDQIDESLQAYINQLLPSERLLDAPIMFHTRRCLNTEQTQHCTSFFQIPIFTGRVLTAVILMALPMQDHPLPLESSCMSGTAHGLIHQVQHLDHIYKISQRDPLTDLFNRRFAEKELERYFDLSKRYNMSLTLLYFDLDHFKSINDQYGHDKGDKVLQHIASHLYAMVRKTDILCRIGGDEFIAILPYTNEDEAIVTVERIYDGLSPEDDIQLSLSTGVAVYHPYEESITHETLLDRADQAMFFAKRLGGSRYRIWHQRNTQDDLQELENEYKQELWGENTKELPLIRIISEDPLLARFIFQGIENIPARKHFSSTINAALHDSELNTQKHQLFIIDAGRRAEDLESLFTIPGAVFVLLATEFGLQELLKHHGCHIFDLVQKPFSTEELLMAVNRALDYIHLSAENEMYQRELVGMVNKKNAQFRNSLNRIKGAYEYTLDTMINLLDAREHETTQHSRRVRDLSLFMAQTMNLKEREIQEIGQGALFHDIGKISIPDAILLKQTDLTPEEWKIMERHPDIGYSFLHNNPLMETASEIVRSHHERFDGSGYPRHLSGQDICLGARIFAIIDSYDAMRSIRSYKDGLPSKEALAEIQRHRGTLFEPEIVDVFTEHIDEIEKLGKWDLLQ